jgi:hypothetical protein
VRLHPRTLPVQAAEADLRQYVASWVERHDLTWTEAVRGLLAVTERLTTHQLREERHPADPDRGADEA